MRERLWDHYTLRSECALIRFPGALKQCWRSVGDFSTMEKAPNRKTTRRAAILDPRLPFTDTKRISPTEGHAHSAEAATPRSERVYALISQLRQAAVSLHPVDTIYIKQQQPQSTTSIPMFAQTELGRDHNGINVKSPWKPLCVMLHSTKRSDRCQHCSCGCGRGSPLNPRLHSTAAGF